MINIGTHVSSAKSIDLVFDRGKEVGASSIQFFLSSPRSWHIPDRTDREKEAFMEKSKNYGIRPTVAHASYLFNLATDEEELFRKSVNGVIKELSLCEEIGIDYYVIHSGKTKGRSKEEGIKRIIHGLNIVFEKVQPKKCCFLLETLAGQKGEVGENTLELKKLMEPFKNANMGVCIDTAHLFASGYHIDTKEGLESYKREFDTLIGLDKIKVIHCNDSKVPFASKKDRHEHIGKGFIGLKGFEILVNDEYLKRLPFILETPKEGNMDIINIRILQSLVHP